MRDAGGNAVSSTRVCEPVHGSCGGGGVEEGAGEEIEEEVFGEALLEFGDAAAGGAFGVTASVEGGGAALAREAVEELGDGDAALAGSTLELDGLIAADALAAELVLEHAR